MANSKLLKEAIADAKAVKETALANAKIALEEAFTPRLQSMLTQKLRAEAEMEDDAEEVEDDFDSTDMDSMELDTVCTIVLKMMEGRREDFCNPQWYHPQASVSTKTRGSIGDFPVA